MISKLQFSTMLDCHWPLGISNCLYNVPIIDLVCLTCQRLLMLLKVVVASRFSRSWVTIHENFLVVKNIVEVVNDCWLAVIFRCCHPILLFHLIPSLYSPTSIEDCILPPCDIHFTGQALRVATPEWKKASTLQYLSSQSNKQ